MPRPIRALLCLVLLGALVAGCGVPTGLPLISHALPVPGATGTPFDGLTLALPDGWSAAASTDRKGLVSAFTGGTIDPGTLDTLFAGRPTGVVFARSADGSESLVLEAYADAAAIPTLDDIAASVGATRFARGEFRLLGLRGEIGRFRAADGRRLGATVASDGGEVVIAMAAAASEEALERIVESLASAPPVFSLAPSSAPSAS